MSENIRITVLVENTVDRQGLVAEHGLSFHVQFGSRSLLFDTGQTDLALINAETLRLRLDRLDAIVLSHGHYDHTGGLPAILDAAPEARLYLHPSALEDKYTQGPAGPPRFIGMSERAAQVIRHRPRGFVGTMARTEVGNGVFVTGEIPRRTDYEDTGGPFFLDAGCMRQDPLTDDQALVIDLGRSVIVLLGCAHAGVVNTLDYVAQLTGGKPVRGVLGGFHLGAASEHRIEQTLSCLRQVHCACLVPVHCTGWPAAARLWQAFPAACRSGSTGSAFDFETD
jgi:7,8-dihydropterin-6-yl-methyl-4-(beta-D-ribofuranosyl)aminobenzene 5'-phosphate synthase